MVAGEWLLRGGRIGMKKRSLLSGADVMCLLWRLMYARAKWGIILYYVEPISQYEVSTKGCLEKAEIIILSLCSF